MTESNDNDVAVKIKFLSKCFGDLEVLRNISITVKKGQTISILGPSGSGKSTLLRCINWLEQPDKGKIYIAGQRIGLTEDNLPQAKKELEKIRARTAMVFQSFNLWPHLTVLGNVIESPIHVLKIPKAEAISHAEELLKKVGLEDKKDVYPWSLSGGQKQRVAIARALAMKPEVILFDEPTSALDPELVDEVLNTMKDLAQEGYTMIVVTHEMEFARRVSDEVVFMEKGVVVRKAPPEEFFTNVEEPRLKQFLGQYADQ